MNLPLPLEYLVALLVALAFDQLFGEPPARLHPVVWMGYLVKFWDRLAPKKNSNLQLLYGLFTLFLSVGGLFWLSSWFLDWLRGYSQVATLILEAYLLKGSLSVRMLGEAGLKIRHLLKDGKLDEARFEMRSLVSRDTSKLNDQLIIAAAVESVAENTTDSFVSPLFFFALLGVPGALAYRLTNTFDSMIGYRGRYEYLGKAAARLDDILNFIPARFTACLLIISAGLYKADRRNAWRIARRDHRNTSSPNAGWTMAAMAGALHARLEKSGHYSLGDDERPLSINQINQAVAALYFVVLETVALYGLGAAIITFIKLS